jgi:CRP-like cAMP-binding protein
MSGALALDVGREDTRAIRRVGPGTLLDESALLAPGFRTETATATAPTTTVAIPRSVVMRVLEAYPSNAVALRRYWAERLSGRLEAFRAVVRP